MLNNDIKSPQSTLAGNAPPERQKTDRVKPKYFIVGSAVFLLALVGIKQIISRTTEGVPNEIETSNAIKNIDIVGVVHPQKIVRISPEVDTSKVTEILVQEGSKVSKGQPLVVLAGRPAQNQVKQYQQDVENEYKIYLEKSREVRQAELALAGQVSENALSPIKNLQSDGSVEQAKSRIHELKLTLQKIEPRLQRYRLLASQGAITSQLLDDLEISYIRTQQELQSADISLNMALAKTRENQVALEGNQVRLEKLNATLKVAQLEAEAAKSNWMLSKRQLTQLQTGNTAVTSLSSPVVGMVVEKIAVVGDVLNANQYLLAIAEKSKFELHVVAHHYQVPCLLESQSLMIASPGNENLKLKGLSTREGEIDKSGKPTIIIDLPVNPQLRPEMTLQLKTTCTKA
jgi:multidrug efflux pump subunit AcrA (membrane-fusion protein)